MKEIKCPRCGDSHKIELIGYDFNNGDNKVFYRCHRCNKRFTIKISDEELDKIAKELDEKVVRLFDRMFKDSSNKYDELIETPFLETKLSKEQKEKSDKEIKDFIETGKFPESKTTDKTIEEIRNILTQDKFDKYLVDTIDTIDDMIDRHKKFIWRDDNFLNDLLHDKTIYENVRRAYHSYKRK